MDYHLTIKRLESGWVHITGNGPCEWCQPPSWPCTDAELEASMFPEASTAFRRAVADALAKAREGVR